MRIEYDEYDELNLSIELINLKLIQFKCFWKIIFIKSFVIIRRIYNYIFFVPSN